MDGALAGQRAIVVGGGSGIGPGSARVPARHGEVEDIAQAVRYFAGPESSWVTGQVLTVDGGNTLRSFIDYRKLIPLPDEGDLT